MANRICTKCGGSYRGLPATSRENGEMICPDCGIREALEGIGVGAEEQEKILRTIHEHTQDQENKK